MAKTVKVKAYKRLSELGKIQNVDAHMRRVEILLQREQRVRDAPATSPEKAAQKRKLLNTLQTQFAPSSKIVRDYYANAKQLKIGNKKGYN